MVWTRGQPKHAPEGSNIFAACSETDDVYHFVHPVGRAQTEKESTIVHRLAESSTHLWVAFSSPQCECAASDVQEPDFLHRGDRLFHAQRDEL